MMARHAHGRSHCTALLPTERMVVHTTLWLARLALVVVSVLFRISCFAYYLQRNTLCVGGGRLHRMFTFRSRWQCQKTLHRFHGI